MFDDAFHSRINGILAELSDMDEVSMATVGSCLALLRACLQEAEVREACVHQFMDLVLDRVCAATRLSGEQLARELRALLDETPGLGTPSASLVWPDGIMGKSVSRETRWDVKELDNRLLGCNFASPSRLKRAMGLTSERRMRPGVAVSRHRRFHACGTMQFTDRHDADITGEQVNRLIRCLGWGDSDSDPRGGRHAILG